MSIQDWQLDTSLLKFHIYNSSQSLRFQYIITIFELVCTSNFDTMFSWLKYWQTQSYITNYYAKHVFFYSLLLIQIYWITYYVGSLTGGSDQSSNGSVTSCAHKFFCHEFWQHGNVSTQQFIYRGTTVATDISDVSRPVQ
jgi:hypothetical protein